MNSLLGGCHCGAIKYEINGLNFAADYCHCKTCQKITGAPISAWMDFKTKQVSWVKGKVKKYKSSEFIRRGFCKNCGSTLTYSHINSPEYCTLAITSLDNPNLIHPTYHIYTDNQLEWFKIKDSFQRYFKSKT